MALEDEALGLVQGAGLSQDLLRDGELAEVVQAPGQACELDLLGLEAHSLGHARGELADHVGVRARVGVARIDRMGKRCRRAQARRPVGPLGEAAKLGELEQVGAVDAHAVLAVLLGQVEGRVGHAHELGALDAVLRIGRDAGRDRDVSAVLALGVGDALDDRLRDREAFVLVAARQEERELVAAEPERLAALAEARGDLREHAVADRVAEAIVDLLEVVDVEQAEGQRDAALLCLVEVALQPLVEVPVVPEPGQRVGEREAHGLEGAVHRALVEGDRDERAHERDGEERRALPEHREHEADRRHDRERHRSPVDGLAKQRQERLTRPPRDDRGDQRDVDRVERRRGEQHLQEERGDSRLPRSRWTRRDPPRRRPASRPRCCRTGGSRGGAGTVR